MRFSIGTAYNLMFDKDHFKDIARRSFFYVVAHGEYNPVLELSPYSGRGGGIGGASEISSDNVYGIEDISIYSNYI